MSHSKTVRYFLFGCMVAGLVNLSGCAGTTRNLNVKEADESMVKNCKFLGTFSSSFYDHSRAMNFAIDDAAKKGATHYVVMDTASQYQGHMVTMSRIRIRGYKCDGNKSTSAVKAIKQDKTKPKTD